MKIGIITLVGNNYGNRLQNYAVQEILKEYGEVYTVKQEKKQTTSKKANIFLRLNPFHILHAIDNRLLNLYFIRSKKNVFAKLVYFATNRNKIKSVMNKRNHSFKEFDNKYIDYEEEIIRLNMDENEEWLLEYDAWVCGSDQIWNPKYPTATRNAFLQFCNKERRIALSASIGLSDYKDMPIEYVDWIKNIPYLSVRENEAASIVKHLTNCDAKVFLDPTMILSTSKWIKMIDECEMKLPEKYALTYFLGEKDKLYDRYISREVSNRNSDLIEILNGEDLDHLSMGPIEVLKAIKYADVIYTDSFHGVVFSILFHKQFVVFQRKESGKSMNSRIETLLSKFNLKERIYSSSNIKLNNIIDYSNVDTVLENERLIVKSFLNNAFNNISKIQKQEINKKTHIVIEKKDKCFGCTACVQACPKTCIEMKFDDEGFAYPVVDEEKCINCGKCIQVCPYNNQKTNEIKEIFAAINNNDEIRKGSSSGGTFYEISKYILSKNGVVYGCAWDENVIARHIRVDTVDNIRLLQGSKYVQSHLGDTFKLVKNDLQENKIVLFSGTPCQVAGLKNFLGRDYENLILLDVLCHGVPSPKIFNDYVNVIQNKFQSKIVNINLRDKKKSWHRLHTRMKFNNGKEYFVFCGYDKYMSMFLNNISLRPSCYNCKFTKKTRQGDISLGDFWGIGKYHYEFDDDKGTSLIIINSNKGLNIWESINGNFKYKKTTFQIAEAGNKVLSEPTSKNANRDSFYELYIKEGYKSATDKYVQIPSKSKRLYYDFRRFILDIVRFILKRKY